MRTKIKLLQQVHPEFRLDDFLGARLMMQAQNSALQYLDALSTVHFDGADFGGDFIPLGLTEINPSSEISNEAPFDSLFLQLDWVIYFGFINLKDALEKPCPDCFGDRLLYFDNPSIKSDYMTWPVTWKTDSIHAEDIQLKRNLITVHYPFPIPGNKSSVELNKYWTLKESGREL